MVLSLFPRSASSVHATTVWGGGVQHANQLITTKGPTTRAVLYTAGSTYACGTYNQECGLGLFLCNSGDEKV